MVLYNRVCFLHFYPFVFVCWFGIRCFKKKTQLSWLVRVAWRCCCDATLHKEAVNNKAQRALSAPSDGCGVERLDRVHLRLHEKIMSLRQTLLASLLSIIMNTTY